MRTEFDFERTKCSCPECIDNCRRMSGSLIPNDLPRLLPEDINKGLPWALDNLLASPGAIVLTNSGGLQRIPTIVMKRLPDGTCKFLVNNQCAIHDFAPYGCAFFGHGTKEEEDKKSWQGLRSIVEDSENARAYRALWKILHENGNIAKGPEELSS